MSVIITVHFAGDPRRIAEVHRTHPNLDEAIAAVSGPHGLVHADFLYGEDGVLEISEWESAEGHQAFLAEAQPHLDRWRELSGITGIRSQVWRKARPEEDS